MLKPRKLQFSTEYFLTYSINAVIMRLGSVARPQELRVVLWNFNEVISVQSQARVGITWSASANHRPRTAFLWPKQKNDRMSILCGSENLGQAILCAQSAARSSDIDQSELGKWMKVSRKWSNCIDCIAVSVNSQETAKAVRGRPVWWLHIRV